MSRNMLLVSGGTVITVNANRDVIEDGAVLVEGDRIKAVGRASELERQYSGAERIDARGKAVFPGIVNTHTHLFQTLLKGPGDDKRVHNWLRMMTGPAAVQLTEEDCYVAAQHGAVEMIHSGCTTVVDFMYVHPRPKLTDAVVRGLDEAGMRGIVGRGFVSAGIEEGMPEPLIEPPEDTLSDCERLINMHNNKGNRIEVGMAPCITWMVPPPVLADTRHLAGKTGCLLTIHLTETSLEPEITIRKFGARELDVMESVGLLGPDLLAVHCTKLNDRDIRIMRAFDVKTAHCPCANMYLASGVAPIPQMLMAGLTVGLGSDGPASNNNQNMIQLLKFTALLQKVAHEDATIITAEKVVEMATIDGARAIGKEKEIGSLEAGKKADLSIMAFDNPFVMPVHSPVSALVYSALGNEAETVILDGQVVMRDRVITTLDELQVREQAQKAADGLVQRAGIGHLARRSWSSLSF